VTWVVGRQIHPDDRPGILGQGNRGGQGRRAGPALAECARRAGGVVEVEPARVVALGRGGDGVVDRGVAEGHRPGRIEHRRDNRVEPRQVGAADPIAAFHQHRFEQAGGARIGELGGGHGGADGLVTEGHHPSRRPERIVVAHLEIGPHRRPRLPGAGIERVAFESADRRMFLHRHQLPAAEREPEGEQAPQRRPGLHDVLPTLAPLVRTVGADAERRTDVLQVVPDPALAVLGHDGVEGIAGLHVGEVHPRTEDAQRPELAPVLMLDDVVGIVGPRALVAEAAEDPSGQAAAGRDAVDTLGCHRRARQYLVQVVGLHRRATAGRPSHRRLRVDDDVVAAQAGEVIFDLVVAERPEQLGRDHQRPGRAFGVRRGVEGHEPGGAGGVAGGESGGEATGLLAYHGQRTDRGRRQPIGADRDLGRRHRAVADAVGEPARVGHFVEGVDVAGATASRRPARGHGVGVGQVIGEIDLPRLRHRGVLGLGFHGQRIIAEETRLLRLQRRQRGHQRQRRDGGAPLRTPRSHRPPSGSLRCYAPGRTEAASRPGSLFSPRRFSSARRPVTLPAS
jgi:hypothetical protein